MDKLKNKNIIYVILVVVFFTIILLFSIFKDNQSKKGLWLSGDESNQNYYEIIVFKDNSVQYTKYYGCEEYFGCDKVGTIVEDIELGYIENGNIIFDKTKNPITNQISKKDVEYYKINEISSSLFNLEGTQLNFEKISKKTESKELDQELIKQMESKKIFSVINYNQYKDNLTNQQEWFLYVCDDSCTFNYHELLYDVVKAKNIIIKYLDVEDIPMNDSINGLNGYPTLFKYNGEKVIKQISGKVSNVEKLQTFFQ